MTDLPVRLRAAHRGDLDAIVALDRATHLAPHWPVDVYAAIVDAGFDLLRVASARCLIVAERIATGAMQPGLLVGFAVGLVHGAGGPADSGVRLAELEDVVVDAGWRRAGTGRALCCAVLDWCHARGAAEVTLEVRAGNAGAIALYADLGFVQVGRRPGYYSGPEDDAIVMLLRWHGSIS